MGRENIQFYVCDVTENVYAERSAVCLLEVYSIGYSDDTLFEPSENQMWSVLMVSTDELPTEVVPGDSPKVFVDKPSTPNPSIAAIRWDDSVVSRQKCDDELVAKLERVIEKMDDDGKYSPLEKVTVNGTTVEV